LREVPRNAALRYVGEWLYLSVSMVHVGQDFRCLFRKETQIHIKFPVLHSPLVAAGTHLYPFTKPRISYC